MKTVQIKDENRKAHNLSGDGYGSVLMQALMFSKGELSMREMERILGLGTKIYYYRDVFVENGWCKVAISDTEEDIKSKAREREKTSKASNGLVKVRLYKVPTGKTVKEFLKDMSKGTAQTVRKGAVTKTLKGADKYRLRITSKQFEKYEGQILEFIGQEYRQLYSRQQFEKVITSTVTRRHRYGELAAGLINSNYIVGTCVDLSPARWEESTQIERGDKEFIPQYIPSFYYTDKETNKRLNKTQCYGTLVGPSGVFAVYNTYGTKAQFMLPLEMATRDIQVFKLEDRRADWLKQEPTYRMDRNKSILDTPHEHIKNGMILFLEPPNSRNKVGVHASKETRVTRSEIEADSYALSALRFVKPPERTKKNRNYAAFTSIVTVDKLTSLYGKDIYAPPFTGEGIQLAALMTELGWHRVLRRYIYEYLPAGWNFIPETDGHRTDSIDIDGYAEDTAGTKYKVVSFLDCNLPRLTEFVKYANDEKTNYFEKGETVFVECYDFQMELLMLTLPCYEPSQTEDIRQYIETLGEYERAHIGEGGSFRSKGHFFLLPTTLRNVIATFGDYWSEERGRFDIPGGPLTERQPNSNTY